MSEEAISTAPQCVYEFESFRVDPSRRRLWRGSQAIPLTSKTFDILLALVENSGRTVEKEELMDRVWADTFVEEGNLNRNISTLRRVLGDDGHQQRYIRTIPKHGYRFTAPVSEIPIESGELVGNQTSVKLSVWEETVETGARSTSRLFFRFAVALVLVLIGAVALAWFWGLRDNHTDALSGAVAAKNEDAFAAYQKGRALWQTRSGTDLHEATLLLEEAVRLDANFALAHAALADAYSFDYRLWPQAEAEAQEAIRLDPSLGQPHATIGFVRMFWEWKLWEAEAEFKQAIGLSPEYATAHQWYALNLFALGAGGNAALVEMKRAHEIEPDSLSISSDLCQAFYFLRQYDEAIAQCRQVLAANPNSHGAMANLYEVYSAAGMHDEAFEMYFRLNDAATQKIPPDAIKQLRESYRTGGIEAFWQECITTLPTSAPNRYRAAKYYALLDDAERVFANLEESYEMRDFEFVFFMADPLFENVRRDARYADLKANFLGFPEK